MKKYWIFIYVAIAIIVSYLLNNEAYKILLSLMFDIFELNQNEFSMLGAEFKFYIVSYIFILLSITAPAFASYQANFKKLILLKGVIFISSILITIFQFSLVYLFYIITKYPIGLSIIEKLLIIIPSVTFVFMTLVTYFRYKDENFVKISSFRWWKIYSYVFIIIAFISLIKNSFIYLLVSMEPQKYDLILILTLFSISIFLVTFLRFLLKLNIYAFILATLLSINPIIWLLNCIYILKRWNIYKKV